MCKGDDSMKVTTSKFLTDSMPVLKQLISILQEDFRYVSILGTDVTGKMYRVQKAGTTISDSMWVERGFVVRVHNGINYSEFSFNKISADSVHQTADEISSKMKNSINVIPASMASNPYPLIEEEAVKKEFTGDVGLSPDDMSAGEIIKKLTSMMERAFNCSGSLIEFITQYEGVHVSKIFMSNKKELRQSYIWSQGYLVPVLRNDGGTKNYIRSFSGLKGPELMEEMDCSIEDTVRVGEGLLHAGRIEPGEYDVICAPEISGLIAHEAFGHGVEMDMFVKGRAKAVEYLRKPVASGLVTMHDGASAAANVSSYLFDDEGTLGTDTVIIENGILKSGISDLLSALKLGTIPTGNGKRESFERKAYARMTNTFISPGNDRVEDMIASIKSGYLLNDYLSGMEDPKNWGIQCIIVMGHEIKNGKLTGKIVSPVIMTGYVPDVLKSISMVSGEISLSGSGACGKGHKEYVKAADGGPYIKARVRLG
jgi:Predicted Zn-dependent proteases and their inactivated homologs